MDASRALDQARDLYLNLLKHCLTNWIYGEYELIYFQIDEKTNQKMYDYFTSRGLQVVQRHPMDPQKRAEGRDWPATAHTMAGLKRLDNTRHCVERVLQDGVPGDLIETGVWRGGMTIFMRAILKAWGVTDRAVWVADSFQGLPAPDREKYPEDAPSDFHLHSQLAVPLEQVRANFEKYGLLDDQVKFLKGWFRDTLPTAPIERLAVIRLDGDMYESTMDGLTHLYPKLSPGGFLIVDDYGSVPPCKKAVHDYREAHGIEDEIQTVDWTGSFWRKSGG